MAPPAGVPVRALIALLAGLVVLPTPGARAQSIRGTVTSSVGGHVLGGVVLELRDASTASVANTLTTEAGGFVLRAPAPGSYTITARRIGYLRRTLGPFTIAGDTAIGLVMESIPQQLPAVTAEDRSTCRQRPGDATATGVLWESALTALLASAVTLREGGYVFAFASQQREYTFGPTTLREVNVSLERVRDVKPWTTLPVADLARLGFVHLSKERQLVFAAPDLDVLTSPVFAARHCFSVRDDGDHPGLVGLEFRPARGIEVADVRGTLWLTRDSLALESLDFSFTGIHYTGHDTLAGGRIVFARLEGGAWVPTEWVIRSPVPPVGFINSVARRGRSRLRRGEDVALAPADPRWEASRVLVTGGSVLELRRDSDSAAVWTRPVGSLEVTVNWRRGDRGTAAGIPVRLRGLGATAITDADGRARFDSVPPGDYLLDTTSELQDLLRLPAELRAVLVRGAGLARARLTALPATNAINTVCAFNGDNAVVGGVVTQDGKEQLWTRIRIARARVDESGRERLTTVKTGWSGTGGRFFICRVPRGERFVVLASYEDGVVVRKEIDVPALAPGQPRIHHVRIDFSAPSTLPVVANAGASVPQRQQ